MSSRLILLTAVLTVAVVLGSAEAKGPDPCISSAVILDQNGNPVVGTGTWLACPQGDGPPFADIAGWGPGQFYIRIEAVDNSGVPYPGIIASDCWLIDCTPPNELNLCGGAGSSNTDSSTNGQGITTFSTTTLSAGGCADGLGVVVLGMVLVDPSTGCTTIKCLPVNVRSPDIDGDGQLTLIDLSIFAAAYAGPYDTCSDFDGNGVVDLLDLTAFAEHFGPPGHACPF